MPSEYVLATEYPYYGIPDCTTAQQVRQASTTIDTFLNRSEGMVWAPDSFGRPCYMVGAALGNALGAPTLQAAIAPGQSVVIPWFYPSYDLIGEVFVVDRLTPGLCEAVSVIGIDPTASTITLGVVQRAHSAGATMESGLAILEDRALPAKRSIARTSRPNLVGILSICGRYGYGRRSDQSSGYLNDINLLASLQTLGGFDTWQPIDVGTCSVSPVTGEIWVTPGLALAYFSEVRIRYIAGFSQAAVPSAIKQATANIVANLAASADSGGSPIYKVMQAGGSKLERFSNTFIDDDTQTLLSSFRTRVLV